MKTIFKPEDFANPLHCHETPLYLANIANQVFNKWLESQTVVYADDKHKLWFERPEDKHKLWFERPEDKKDTHKALLINIEPIVKEPCKHPREEMVTYPTRQDSYHKAKCGVCGVELVAEWREK